MSAARPPQREAAKKQTIYEVPDTSSDEDGDNNKDPPETTKIYTSTPDFFPVAFVGSEVANSIEELHQALKNGSKVDASQYGDGDVRRSFKLHCVCDIFGDTHKHGWGTILKNQRSANYWGKTTITQIQGHMGAIVTPSPSSSPSPVPAAETQLAPASEDTRILEELRESVYKIAGPSLGEKRKFDEMLEQKNEALSKHKNLQSQNTRLQEERNQLTDKVAKLDRLCTSWSSGFPGACLSWIRMHLDTLESQCSPTPHMIPKHEVNKLLTPGAELDKLFTNWRVGLGVQMKADVTLGGGNFTLTALFDPNLAFSSVNPKITQSRLNSVHATQVSVKGCDCSFCKAVVLPQALFSASALCLPAPSTTTMPVINMSPELKLKFIAKLQPFAPPSSSFVTRDEDSHFLELLEQRMNLVKPKQPLTTRVILGFEFKCNRTNVYNFLLNAEHTPDFFHGAKNHYVSRIVDDQGSIGHNKIYEKNGRAGAGMYASQTSSYSVPTYCNDSAYICIICKKSLGDVVRCEGCNTDGLRVYELLYFTIDTKGTKNILDESPRPANNYKTDDVVTFMHGQAYNTHVDMKNDNERFRFHTHLNYLNICMPNTVDRAVSLGIMYIDPNSI